MAKNNIKSEIVFNANGEFNFHSVPESICIFICNIEDQGDRYSKHSRYIYSYQGYDENDKNIIFGTAKACIQSYIMSLNKENENFDINTFTSNGDILTNKRPLCTNCINDTIECKYCTNGNLFKSK